MADLFDQKLIGDGLGDLKAATSDTDDINGFSRGGHGGCMQRNQVGHYDGDTFVVPLDLGCDWPRSSVISGVGDQFGENQLDIEKGSGQLTDPTSQLGKRCRVSDIKLY